MLYSSAKVCEMCELKLGTLTAWVQKDSLHQPYREPKDKVGHTDSLRGRYLLWPY